MKRWLCLLLVAGFAQAHMLGQAPACGSSSILPSPHSQANEAQIHAVIAKHLQENSAKQTATIVIPTVFHIVYNTPQQNIPDSVIQRQLQIMNDDFQRKNADTVNTPLEFQGVAGKMDIEFCLAQQTPTGSATTGIVRISTNVTAFNSPTTYAVPDPVKHTNSGGSDAWDTEHYLNIWICNLNGSTAYSAPPGNFLPDDEGIVCKYQHIGWSNVYPYGRGRSIVHELGHYFCLKHIWGDDQGTCNGTDYIGDTPNQANYSTNCPNFPLTDACTPNSPGVMYMNYMDYSEDGCRNLFSAGQTAYMLSCITSLRTGFLNAQGCVPVVGTENMPSTEWTMAQNETEIQIRGGQASISALQVWDLQGGSLFEVDGLTGKEISIPKTTFGEGLVVIEARNGWAVKRWKAVIW
jgi:hypothetical protein